jgi:hypothetical protein
VRGCAPDALLRLGGETLYACRIVPQEVNHWISSRRNLAQEAERFSYAVLGVGKVLQEVESVHVWHYRPFCF